MTTARSISERFWAKVDRDSGGCWKWQGGKRSDGYGLFQIGPKSRRAHRVAYVLVKGPIPAGLDVLHHCDNPPCCNPDHLFVGTDLDNARDCREKGRGSRGAPRGSAHHSYKLSDEDVAAIQSSSGPLREIAEQFGISAGYAYDLRTGRARRLKTRSLLTGMEGA